MSKTIDERVVEMRFDNQQFERNVATSMSTLGKLKKSLDLEGASKGLENVGAAAKNCDMSGLTSAVQTVQSKFSALEVMGITALANLTNSAVNAGKRIVSALTIDPIKTGFNEYELKMGSIQTIMAGTGESLETVNKYLAELNTYSDRTIYSFADMTSNIGKFTNAGVKLDDAVAAIKGVSNVAAVSGANANEASRAMYNFAQALSAGYVKLIDWKSIENANMATVEFKKYLLDAAVAEGTLTKTTDGMYKTIGKGTIIDATHNFNDSLQEQWMTTDALVSTLKQYADETTEIGKKAYASAQDVKTFSQLFDTLKEAAQSGWASTWEIMVGDFEEAKKLLTEINDVVSGLIGASADARNQVLQGWKDLGGRTAVIDAFRNAFEGLMSVMKPIGEAFRDIFPATTARQLLGFSLTLKSLSYHLKLSDTASENLKTTFKGLFAVLDIAKQAFSAAFEVVKPLIGTADDLGGGILGMTAGLGGLLIKLDEAIKKSEVFRKIAGGIASFLQDAIGCVKTLIGFLKENIVFPGFEAFHALLEKIHERMGDIGSVAGSMKSGVVTAVEAIGAALSKCDFLKMMEGIWKAVQTIAGGFGKALGDLIQGLQKSAGGADFNGFLDLLNGGLLAGIGIGINKLIGSLAKVAKDGSGAVSGILSIKDAILDTFGAFQSQLKAGTLMKIAAAIGILAASILVISSIDSARLASSLGAITVLFANLMLSMSAFGKMEGNLKGAAKTCSVMIAISVSVLILASALKKIAELDGGQLVLGFAGVAGLTAMMVSTAQVLSKNAGSVTKGMGQMILFAAAVKILASAVKDLASLNWSGLGKGLSSVAILLTQLAIFTKATGNTKGLISTGISLTAIGIAMKIFASAVEDFGSMQWDTIGRGLAAMAGSLGAVVIAMNLMPKTGMVSAGVGLVAVSSALLILSKALSGMGNMEWDEIGRGLSVLGGSLGILAIALRLMTGTLAGSAALLVAAGALAILTPVLSVLGAMSGEAIAKSLITIAGAFSVIGVAAAILTPLLPTILGIGAAFALVGVGVAGIGAGLLAAGLGLSALAVGITALATAGAAGAATIVASLSVIIVGIAGLIPAIMIKIGEGIVAFCGVIKNSIPAILDTVVTVVSAMLQAVATLAPQIIETAVTLLDELLKTLAEHMPSIVQAGFDILIGFLRGIRDNIDGVVSVAVEIVTAFISSVAMQIPQMTQSAFELVISFVDALGETIRDETPRLVEAMVGLAGNIVQGLIDGLFSGVKGVKDAIWNLGETAINGIKDVLGIHSPSKVMASAGQFVSQGFANGIKAYQSVAEKASVNLGSAVVTSLKDRLKIQSPSKVTRDEVGRYIVQGIAEGITKDMSAEDAATKKAQNIVNAFKTELDKLDLDATTSELEYQLWGKLNPEASSTQQNSAQINLLSSKLQLQNEKVKLAQSEYQTTLATFGKNSEKAQEAYNKYLQEQIDLSDLQQELNELKQTTTQDSSNAMVEYAQYISDYQEDLLKMGFTMDQIKAAAAEKSGYYPTEVQGGMDGVVEDAVTNAMGTVQTAYQKSAEGTLGALTANFGEYGTDYAEAVGTGIQNGSETAASAAEIMVQTCASKLRAQSSVWIECGKYLVDSFASGIRANADRAAAEASAMAQKAVSGLSYTISQIAEAVEGGLDTRPTIRPVLDLSAVESGATRLNTLFSRSQALSVNSEIGSSAAKKASISASGASSGNATFIQNNYSPKALSRLEIYRQSKNLFSAQKGAVNA